MMTPFNDRKLKNIRQQLRKSTPETEKILWARIRRRQINGIKFRRQQSIGPYILDFYSFEIDLGIEIDGPSHYLPEHSVHEKQRNQFLAGQTLQLLRFQNSEIYENLEGVLITIQEKVAEILRNEARP